MKHLKDAYQVAHKQRASKGAPKEPRGRPELLAGKTSAQIDEMIREEKAYINSNHERGYEHDATDLQVKLAWEHRLQFITDRFDLHIARLPFKKKNGGKHTSLKGKETFTKGYVVFKPQEDGKFILDTGTFLAAASALVNPGVSSSRFWETIENHDLDSLETVQHNSVFNADDLQEYQHQGTFAGLRAHYDPDSHQVTVFGRPTSETRTAQRNFGLAAALHVDEDIIKEAYSRAEGATKEYLGHAMEDLAIERADIGKLKDLRRNKYTAAEAAKIAERKALKTTEREANSSKVVGKRTAASAMNAFMKRAQNDEDRRQSTLAQARSRGTGRAGRASNLSTLKEEVETGNGSTGGRYYSYMDYPY